MSVGNQSIFERLAAPFHSTEIRKRTQAKREFTYITARVAMNRLDEILGGENWKDEYTETEKGLKCRLWFRIPGTDEWLWKEDGGAPAGMQEADNDEKSAYSDAFKRAAVKLGVARYLYNDGVPIYPEQEHVNGEVVQEYKPAPPVKSSKGLYTKPQVKLTTEFNAWMSEQCKKVNGKWQDEWDARLQAFQADGLAVPDKIPDVINPWQAKGHLLKWAVESERLDPTIVPEDAKTRQADAYVALVFHNPEHRAALKVEMGDYLLKQRQIKSDLIYRKHPDLAPAGWAEEQDEAYKEDALDSLDRAIVAETETGG